MNNIIDLTRATMAPYRFAEIIEQGDYADVLCFEFHSHLNPENEVYESDRLRSFCEASNDFYTTFICNSYPDEFEAVIDVAIKLCGQWFIIRQCGANYYLGFGPQGILKLRKACSLKRIPIIVSEENLDDWLKYQANDISVDINNEFELIVNIIRNMGADFERRPNEYRGIKEESIRDRLLAPINAAVSGRANGEAKNGEGKTDILVRTKKGNNEYIFELKVWGGKKSLQTAITQIRSYLSWNTNSCGIVIISYNKSFTNVLKTCKEILTSMFEKIETHGENNREFRFKMKIATDTQKYVEVTMLFINLYKA